MKTHTPTCYVKSYILYFRSISLRTMVCILYHYYQLVLIFIYCDWLSPITISKLNKHLWSFYWLHYVTSNNHLNHSDYLNGNQGPIDPLAVSIPRIVTGIYDSRWRASSRLIEFTPFWIFSIRCTLYIISTRLCQI